MPESIQKHDYTKTQHDVSQQLIRWFIGVVIATIIWFYVYSQLIPFADWIVSLTPFHLGTPIGEAIHFFFTTHQKFCYCWLVLCILWESFKRFLRQKERVIYSLENV